MNLLCFKVEASELTPTQIKYTCPFCFDKYKKDGTPYKKAKNVEHCYGFTEWRTESNLNIPFDKIDFTEYEISRSKHCDSHGCIEFDKQYNSGVEITITKNTKINF